VTGDKECEVVALTGRLGVGAQLRRVAEDDDPGRGADDLLDDRDAVAERRDEAGDVVVGVAAACDREEVFALGSRRRRDHRHRAGLRHPRGDDRREAGTGLAVDLAAVRREREDDDRRLG
jgi:hypothetical protein